MATITVSGLNTPQKLLGGFDLARITSSNSSTVLFEAGWDQFWIVRGTDLVIDSALANPFVSGTVTELEFVSNFRDIFMSISGLTISANEFGGLLGADRSGSQYTANIMRFLMSGNDSFSGGYAGADGLLGGDDAVYAGLGDDVVHTLGGNDTIYLGPGAATVDGGSGTDLVSFTEDFAGYPFYASGVSINLASGVGTNYDGSLLEIANIENVTGSLRNDTIIGGDGANTLSGSGGDDRIYGGGGNDTLRGEIGNDVLNGGMGADTLTGGTGNDIYYVDSSGDRVVETSSGGTVDRVYTSVSHTLANYVEYLYAQGSASLSLTGNALSNVISGNSGANKINGGLGKDVLTGGAGKDIFVLNTKMSSSNVDRIVDYNVAYDTIYLENAVFTKLKAGRLVGSAFWKGAAAHDADDRVIYDSAKGYLYYDADGTGASKQVLVATLPKGLKMTYAEFYVI